MVLHLLFLLLRIHVLLGKLENGIDARSRRNRDSILSITLFTNPYRHRRSLLKPHHKHLRVHIDTRLRVTTLSHINGEVRILVAVQIREYDALQSPRRRVRLRNTPFGIPYVNLVIQSAHVAVLGENQHHHVVLLVHHVVETPRVQMHLCPRIPSFQPPDEPSRSF